jgi:hypothetical protein
MAVLRARGYIVAVYLATGADLQLLLDCPQVQAAAPVWGRLQRTCAASPALMPPNHSFAAHMGRSSHQLQSLIPAETTKTEHDQRGLAYGYAWNTCTMLLPPFATQHFRISETLKAKKQRYRLQHKRNCTIFCHYESSPSRLQCPWRSHLHRVEQPCCCCFAHPDQHCASAYCCVRAPVPLTMWTS